VYCSVHPCYTSRGACTATELHCSEPVLLSAVPQVTRLLTPTLATTTGTAMTPSSATWHGQVSIVRLPAGSTEPFDLHSLLGTLCAVSQRACQLARCLKSMHCMLPCCAALCCAVAHCCAVPLLLQVRAPSVVPSCCASQVSSSSSGAAVQCCSGTTSQGKRSGQRRG
jgi:hypothetical protein